MVWATTRFHQHAHRHFIRTPREVNGTPGLLHPLDNVRWWAGQQPNMATPQSLPARLCNMVGSLKTPWTRRVKEEPTAPQWPNTHIHTHHLFATLPSGRRLQDIQTHTCRRRDSFVLKLITSLKKNKKKKQRHWAVSLSITADNTSSIPYQFWLRSS